MPIDRIAASLLFVVCLAALTAVACGESTPEVDVDATIAAGVQATVDANAIARAQATSTPVQIPSTPMPADTPLPAPTPKPAPTSTPEPIPTPTYTPTIERVPTPTAVPIPTPVPTATPVPLPTPTLAQMIEDIEHSLVFIETDTGSGTGFIVDEDGLVVTNEHVVQEYGTVIVVMSDGTEYFGDVLGVDERADLAIVEIRTAARLNVMNLGNSDDVRVGDDVIALGFPLGYELGSSLTVTRGIISSKRLDAGVEVLQTDAAINPGNSGGPLVNRDGKVVGVNYAELALSDGSPVDNIGFSIAVNELKDRMDSLKKGERALQPTPTPGQATTYRNASYGYGLDIAPGWYLDEETEGGDSEFWNEDRTGSLEVITYELGRDWTLEEHAQSERDYLENHALEEGWKVFEITAFQLRLAGGREYYHMAYRWQSSDEYCVSDDVKLIFLSNFYPSKPYGFVANGGVCEHSLRQYGDERDAMLASFVEQDTHPTTPTPTPAPWMTYRNDDYGYTIDIAPGWHLEEEAEDGSANFWNEDRTGLLEVFTYELGRGWTLEEHAQSEREFMEEQAREEGWKVFEITAFQLRLAGGREYYHMAYRWQSSDEYCISNDVSRIFLSDFYPSKPYGFAVSSGVCESDLDRYAAERDAMLASFGP